MTWLSEILREMKQLAKEDRDAVNAVTTAESLLSSLVLSTLQSIGSATTALKS